MVFKVIKNPDIELPFFPYYYLMKDGAVVEEWGGGSERKFTKVLDRALTRFSEEENSKQEAAGPDSP